MLNCLWAPTTFPGAKAEAFPIKAATQAIVAAKDFIVTDYVWKFWNSLFDGENLVEGVVDVIETDGFLLLFTIMVGEIK